MQKTAKLCAKLKLKPHLREIKIWLFPESDQEKLDVLPFENSIKFSFSMKANAPCRIQTGISNITDYEMVYRTVDIDKNSLESKNCFLVPQKQIST